MLPQIQYNKNCNTLSPDIILACCSLPVMLTKCSECLPLRVVWIRRFIAVSTTARHFSVSSATHIQSTSSQPISLSSILILRSHVRLRHQSSALPSVIPTTTTLHAFLFSPLPLRTTCHYYHMSWFDQPKKMVRTADHSPPHYVTFSRLHFQMSASAPYSWTPSAYVLRLKRETSFHTLARQQAKLKFCIFWRLQAKWLKSLGRLLSLFMPTAEYCFNLSKPSGFFKYHRV